MPAADLVSDLIPAQADGDSLDENELVSMVFLLIVAGHETTVNLIGNGMLMLFEHPDQHALLVQNPALLRGAVEEILRYQGPAEMSLVRWAREDVEIGEGRTIRRGEPVVVILAAAVRDRWPRCRGATTSLPIFLRHHRRGTAGQRIEATIRGPDAITIRTVRAAGRAGRAAPPRAARTYKALFGRRVLRETAVRGADSGASLAFRRLSMGVGYGFSVGR